MTTVHLRTVPVGAEFYVSCGCRYTSSIGGAQRVDGWRATKLIAHCAMHANAPTFSPFSRHAMPPLTRVTPVDILSEALEAKFEK